MKENPYDNQNFFESYSQMQRSTQGLSAAGEWHELQAMLPDFTNTSVLDLGCGFGWHCQYAAQHGAKKVIGTDISEKMLDVAREKNNYDNVTYKQGAMEDLSFPDESFDVVISSLALHYVEKYDALIQNIYKMLKPNGMFIFSAEHPVFTAEGSQDWFRDEKGNVQFWMVDCYFQDGKRNSTFLENSITKYHRSLTQYIRPLLKAGFELVDFVEPMVSEEVLQQFPEWAIENRRPMMLIMSCRKK